MKIKSLFMGRFWLRNRLNFIMGCVFIVLVSAAQICMAFLLQMLIDVATDGTISDLIGVVVFSIIILAVFMIAAIGRKIFIHRFYFNALTSYKMFAFTQMLSKRINAFNKVTTSKYISALSNDVTSIEINYLENIFELIGYLLLLFGGIAAMAYLNLTLLLSVLIALVFPIMISVLLGGRIAREEKRVSDRNELFVGSIKDIISGFSVVKSFQAESEMQTVFSKKDRSLEKSKKLRRDAVANVEIATVISGMFVFLVVFVVGAYLAIGGVISAGVMVAYIQLLNFVVDPIQKMPPILSKIKAAKELVNKLEQDMIKNEITDDEVQISEFKDRIEFKDVTFGYGNNENVIANLDLTLDKGKKYAVVGTSGSGKSTLMNMLLGYHTDFKGQIEIDGVDIKRISTNSLYGLMSVIQQNVFIFDDDIRSNITMHKNFSEGDVDRAIVQAGLKTLIESKGEAYKCGENGVNLSGGEKQRISIARSLLKNTPILLMDEATSSLDNETATVIEDAILSLDGITRVIVTHKLNETMLKKYDEIIFLRNGAVAERGSFDLLMSRKGYFQSLYDVLEPAKKLA